MIIDSVGLLEREKIIGSALHHAKLKRVVLLKGNKGMGKTELLIAVAEKLAEKSKILPIVTVAGQLDFGTIFTLLDLGSHNY